MSTGQLMIDGKSKNEKFDAMVKQGMRNMQACNAIRLNAILYHCEQYEKANVNWQAEQNKACIQAAKNILTANGWQYAPRPLTKEEIQESKTKANEQEKTKAQEV